MLLIVIYLICLRLGAHIQVQFKFVFPFCTDLPKQNHGSGICSSLKTFNDCPGQQFLYNNNNEVYKKVTKRPCWTIITTTTTVNSLTWELPVLFLCWNELTSFYIFIYINRMHVLYYTIYYYKGLQFSAALKK